MKRDDDYIRSLLIEMEQSDDTLFDSYIDDDHPDNERRHYHFELMEDAGFVRSKNSGMFRLTSQGHDYLDAIRSVTIWNKTKEAVAETGGNATLEIIQSLAIGFLKTKIEKHTGVKL